MTLSSLKTLIEGNTDPSNVELRGWLLEAVQNSLLGGGTRRAETEGVRHAKRDL